MPHWGTTLSKQVSHDWVSLAEQGRSAGGVVYRAPLNCVSVVSRGAVYKMMFAMKRSTAVGALQIWG